MNRSRIQFPQCRHHCSTRGYVLLLTLMMLTIAAMAMAGVCRLSLRQTVQATRAQDDLQRRWGVVSLRSALLPKSKRIFDATATSPGQPATAELKFEIDLGGQPIRLVFGDEQAKPNVNLFYAIGKRDGADRAVRTLLRNIPEQPRIELTPMQLDDADPAEAAPAGSADDAGTEIDIQPVFDTWGQVFPEASPGELISSRSSSDSVAGSLTCWSDGLLNVRRASREAVETVCTPILGQAGVAKLLAARAKDADFDVWDFIDTLELADDRSEKASRLIADESNCYSLWIVTRTAGREWYDLSIDDSAGGAASSPKSFSW